MRALPQSQIEAQMNATKTGNSNGDSATTALQLLRNSRGETVALARQSGRYTLQNAGGKSQILQVPPLMLSRQIEGAWQVSFPPESGAPHDLTLEQLASLSEQSDPAIKYFSGTATYSKKFEIPASVLASNTRLYLDLGEVHSLAEVTLNGVKMGTLWSAPFALDISDVARVGTNALQVKVTNVWHNRLLGQLERHKHLKRPGVEKIWTSTMPNYGPGEPILTQDSSPRLRCAKSPPSLCVKVSSLKSALQVLAVRFLFYEPI